MTVQDAAISYPRPDFDRSERWVSLDGTWEFLPDPAGDLSIGSLADAPLPDRMTVPGPWEEGSVAAKRHDWLEVAWYRREFVVPTDWSSDRVVLKFGAVFYSCEVWLNGDRLGSHEGGYLPFEFDITDVLTSEPAVLVVRVHSPRNKLDIPHGKHRSMPVDDYNGCAFTPASGIWQSVWVEPRPATHLTAVDLIPTGELDGFRVRVRVSGPSADGAIVGVQLEGKPVVPAVVVEGAAETTIRVDEPRLWAPGNPQLYRAVVTVEADGAIDRVTTWSGLRRIEARDRALFLNGQQIYLRGVLDQGYWPGSGLTAPSEDALIEDLELAAAAGFNLVRKHLKAEDPRWLHHADRLGMLVWSEPACLGRFSHEGVARFEAELSGLIERDRNHPSIVIWCAYNEEWGLDWDLGAVEERREAAERAYCLIKDLDPTRVAIENSGWSHVLTDVLDYHYYNQDPHAFHHRVNELLTGGDPAFETWHSPAFPVRKTIALDGFVRDGQPILNSEYGGGWNSVDRAWHARWQTQFLRAQQDNQGYVYTELYDVENEIVGVYTAGRRSKDQGGVDLHAVHAETVLCPLIEPLTAGTDLVARGGAELTIPVVISHHGHNPLTGQLRWQGATSSGAVEITAVPFLLGEPVHLELRLPVGYGRDRFVLSVQVGEDVIARTVIDVADAPPPSNLPEDTPWRPSVVPAGWSAVR